MELLTHEDGRHVRSAPSKLPSLACARENVGLYYGNTAKQHRGGWDGGCEDEVTELQSDTKKKGQMNRKKGCVTGCNQFQFQFVHSQPIRSEAGTEPASRPTNFKRLGG